MQLTPEQQDALKRLWEEFDDREITYVVLRGYTDLPESLAGSDVDVLVAADTFDDAVSYCKQSFETTESIPKNALDLAALIVKRPRAVARDVARQPTEMIATAKNRLTASEVTGRGHIERSFDAAGLQIHMVNHLAYKSPMDGSRVRVDPTIENAMLEHRTRYREFYTPAPPDQLAHLLCRGIYDYDVDFPQRYVNRCDDLFEQIQANLEMSSRFRELLSQHFFQADTLVYEYVKNRAYGEIRSALRRYTDY